MPIPEPKIGRCLYPDGDPLKPETFHWCNAPRTAESSYCEDHHALTHIKGSKGMRSNELHIFGQQQANRKPTKTEEFLERR